MYTGSSRSNDTWGERVTGEGGGHSPQRSRRQTGGEDFFVGQPWEVVMLSWKQSWLLVLSQAQLAVVRILLVASHRNLFELS